MSQPRRVALLWFVGGVALLLAGLLAEPVGLLSVGAGVLFFAVGLVTLARGRRTLITPDSRDRTRQ